jgi:hypothetical protein
VLPEHRSFTLVAPGAEPRTQLRYAVVNGTATLAITSHLASRQLVGGKWSERVTLPAMTTAFGVTLAPGKLVARVMPAKVDDAITPQAEQYLAPWRAIEGRRIALDVDARGKLGRVTFPDDPTGAKSEVAIDDITQRLLATFVPLPEEAVGIGASWRVVTILRQRPVIVKQTAIYKLVAKTSAGWKIEVDLQRVGESQTIIDPSVPPDTVVELVSLVRTLKGTLAVDAATALPAGKLAVESTMHLRLDSKTGGPAEQIFEDTGSIELGQ